jgi:hypothetical protein
MSYTNVADIKNLKQKENNLTGFYMNLNVFLFIPYLPLTSTPLMIERLTELTRTNNKISRIIVILTQPTLSLVKKC